MKPATNLQAALRFCRRQHPQLRVSQLELLLAIQARPGCTQTELATECDLTLSAVSRAVDVLGHKGRRDSFSQVCLGWIETKRNPDDERILQVYLTPKGNDFVSTFEALIHGSPIQS